MRRRQLIRLGIIVLSCFGVWATSVHAQVPALQLCGFSQFVDFVAIGVADLEGPRFMGLTAYTQIVPNAYTILGALNFVRSPINPSVFFGGGGAANFGEPFTQDPSCSLKVTLQQVLDQPIILFSGTSVVTCHVNDGGVVQPTPLNLTLTLCDEEPILPNGQVNLQMLEQSTEQIKRTFHPEDFALDADRAAAGPAFR